ncbi:hypothetical protein DIE22_33350 [Burkholderia sp. Bp9142]|nr:hypothetical protein DIE22_33350 [Burkholderia sp. Bp9142]RQR43963.1 hypothetical protein DIE21_34450 [Burkholderia sp. Bp9140]
MLPEFPEGDVAVKRDKIRYTIRPSGEVVLTRVESSEEDDPVLGQFLRFLAGDIVSHPERLQAIDAELVQRLQSLTVGVEVDLDAPCRQTMNERQQAHTLAYPRLDGFCSPAVSCSA